MNQRFLSLSILLTVLCAFLSASGQTIFRVAGMYSGGYSGDGGPATLATFRNQQGIAVDTAGNIYIADFGNYVIRKVDVHGIITTVAGNGTNSYGGDGGPATSAQLNYPTDVAVDNAGNLYIADNWNNAIRKVNASGVISTIAGNGGGGFSGDGGAATAAKLHYPAGIAVDRTGNVFIADTYNNRIRMINGSGIISTVAGSDSFGYGGDGGPATAAKLSQPNNVAIDTFGNMYIADGSYHMRKVNASGIISTIAGTGTLGFSGDGGPATAARIYGHFGIAPDGAGNVYFADYDNTRVRKIDASGIITTVAGNGSSTYSGDGGPATAAGMHPRGVALRNGALYISDYTNFMVRKVCSYPVVGTIAGSATICEGVTIAFTDTASGGVWSTRDNTIATVSDSGLVTGLAVGNDTVVYTVTNYCSTAYTSAVVTVNPQPNAGMIIGLDSFCYFTPEALGVSGSGGTWSSTNPAVATVSASGVVYGRPPGGLATIRYIATNSCGSDTALLPVKILWPCEGAVQQVSATHDQLSVAPNPGNGDFTLLLSSPFSEKGMATISNILGVKVKEFNFETNTPSGISLQQPAGIYFISVITPHGRFVSRVSVER